MTEPSTHDHPDLVEEWVRTAATNRESFGHLFDHFYSLIFAYCSRRLLVRAIAEDVTSEVFLKVAKAIRDTQCVTTEDFRKWLFRITTNEINAHLRKTIRRREILDAAVKMGAVGKEACVKLLSHDVEVDWEQVYRAIGELTQREQSIISLRFFSSLSHDEIAAVLQLKSGTVRVALNRALNKLRERLQQLQTDVLLTSSRRKRG